MGVIEIVLALTYVAAVAIGFFAGKQISDAYHAVRDQEIKDALQRQYVRLIAGTDADDPAQPYVAPRQNIIDQQFMNHLHQNGKATKAV